MRHKDSSLMCRMQERIDNFFVDCGTTPSVQQLAKLVGISKATAHRYLVDMARQGMIDYDNGVISTSLIEKYTQPVNHAALVGSIPCGAPDEREELVEEYIPLPVSIFGNGNFYVLRASGDSMIEAGIDSGDLVIIQKQQTANLGDIVVALTDEHQNTLKRLEYDDDRECYYLHPENTAYDDIYVCELEIQGVARHVIKAL